MNRRTLGEIGPQSCGPRSPKHPRHDCLHFGMGHLIHTIRKQTRFGRDDRGDPQRPPGCSMAQLRAMPPIDISRIDLRRFGTRWTANKGALSRTPPESSGQLGQLLDSAVGHALAEMLGGIDIVKPGANDLLPSQPDCVEVGEVRIVGGVRPQNFDVGYRPDGLRFALDSKTLNDTKSVGKNYQNMINDLATEATTVHIRFPDAIVAFLVAIPAPCIVGRVGEALIARLEGLAGRQSYNDPAHLAEVLSLVLWDPGSGGIRADVPDPASPLRIEAFSTTVETLYRKRYAGLPPHI